MILAEFLRNNKISRDKVLKEGVKRAERLFAPIHPYLQEDDKILDVGTGVCAVTQYLINQGYDVTPGKLLTNIAKAAKFGIYNYTMSDSKSNTAITIYGNGQTTAARYGQYRDKKYYLYALDTLDYHLRWGNYSAEIRPKTTHSGTAHLIFGSSK